FPPLQRDGTSYLAHQGNCTGSCPSSAHTHTHTHTHTHKHTHTHTHTQTHTHTHTHTHAPRWDRSSADWTWITLPPVSEPCCYKEALFVRRWPVIRSEERRVG